MSLESWRAWWNEVVEIVRTSRLSAVRDVDDDESPAVEVINYRSPSGYFASTFISIINVRKVVYVLLNQGWKNLGFLEKVFRFLRFF